MKRITLILLGLLLAADFIFAGGLVTNTNQSTAWSRMLARDATTEIDAVYFNPAGLVKLQDGFHISLSNQSIFQTRTITTTFPVNNREYIGNTSLPLFPSVYLAYKTGRWAFSLGVNVVGGGGTATFDSGVPMMEIPVASMVPTFSQMGVKGYSVDMSFEGSSTYWGLQAGVSFEITKNISVFAGARYVIAKNTYNGYMRDIRVTYADGSGDRADDFMNDLAGKAEVGSLLTGNTAAAMDDLVSSPLGGLTFDAAIAATAGDPQTQAMITALRDGLIDLGTENAGDITITQGQGAYTAYSEGYAAQAIQLAAGASLMLDQEADITQTGSGITPILGANLSFLDDALNIGIKYEFKTKMDLTNEVPSFVDENGKTVYKGFIVGLDENGDYTYMFPDGEKTNADIPAMLSIGVDYRIIDPLKISVGYHTYFDKQTGWAQEAEDGGQKTIDNNFFEIGLGLQYDINEKFLVSIGYLHANTGVSQAYQSDLSYSLTSNTVGLGGAWAINDVFKLQLGGYYVSYNEETYKYHDYDHLIGDEGYTKTYDKSTWAISLGLDITIGGKKK